MNQPLALFIPSSCRSRVNPSGLLVYQVYGDMTIDGRVVPEVGAWLPVVLAFGLFVRQRYFRRLFSIG